MKCYKTGKVRHATEGAGHVAKKKYNSCLINVYKCEHCKGWHLGRSNDPFREQLRIGELLARHQTELESRLNKNRPTV